MPEAHPFSAPKTYPLPGLTGGAPGRSSPVKAGVGVGANTDALPDGALQVRAERKSGAAVAAAAPDSSTAGVEATPESTASPAPAAPSMHAAKRAAVAQAPASTVAGDDYKQ